MKNLLLKILFVIGIVVILVFLAIGIVKIVPKIVASLGAAGGSVTEKPLEDSSSIEVITSSQELNHDEPFGLTWKRDEALAQKQGVYAVAHNCVNDLTFDIIAKNGASKTLVCNTPFTLGSAPTEITLKPSLLLEDSLRDANLAIIFFENGIETPTNSAKKVVTVRNFSGPTGTLADNNSVITSDLDSLSNSEVPSTDDNGDVDGQGEAPVSPETPTVDPVTPTNPITPTTPSVPVTPLGPADLAINAPVVSGNAVRFSVTNIGERPSGQFTFSYTLPGETSARVSPLQRSLNPREELGLTITIDQTIGGGFSINVNSDNRVVELTKTNNVAAVNLGPITGGPLLVPTDLVLSELQTSSANITTADTLTVFFNIKNNGSATSAFTLEVISPTLNQDVAPSGDGLCALRANRLICSVPEMSANEKRDYSFNINNFARGNNQAVQVVIDTQNVISETSESNNQSSTFVNIY